MGCRCLDVLGPISIGCLAEGKRFGNICPVEGRDRLVWDSGGRLELQNQ